MIRPALITAFKEHLGPENVFHEKEDLLTYSYDAAVLDPVQPLLALRPVSSRALSHAVRLCNENGLPLTVRGAGTNLSGGTIPRTGGVVILTNGLSAILEINTAGHVRSGSAGSYYRQVCSRG